MYRPGCVWCFFHAIILMVGGQYTYEKVPVGFEVQEWLGLSCNPYDKLGHFFQGLVPALVAREILVRGMYVRGRNQNLANLSARKTHTVPYTFIIV